MAVRATMKATITRNGIQVFRKLPKLKEKYRASLNKLINTG